MIDDFGKRISDAAARERAKTAARQLGKAAEHADKAEQRARVQKASADMNGTIRNTFSGVVKDTNDALCGTGKHLIVSGDDNGYSLDITSHTGTRGSLMQASLFVDMEGNIVTTYSDHTELRKFGAPGVMRPERYLNDVVQKVVGDIVEAMTS